MSVSFVGFTLLLTTYSFISTGCRTTSRILALIFIFLILCLQPTSVVATDLEKRSASGSDGGTQLLCTPFGACEPCPKETVSAFPHLFFLLLFSTAPYGLGSFIYVIAELGYLILHIQMNEPFCQPFGNRRQMHCINSTFPAVPHPPPNEPPSNRPPNSDLDAPPGELTAWESCGRIVPKERADFFEFVGCNLIFALVALGVLVLRMKRVRMSQARWLAARIGVGGGGRNMGR